MADSIRHALVPAHATDEKQPDAVPVTPTAPHPRPAVASTATPRDLEDEAAQMAKYREQQRIKRIAIEAAAQIAAARRKSEAERDAWLQENARQAKRDEDERLVAQFSRPSGR